jgi:hypothetical protein
VRLGFGGLLGLGAFSLWRWDLSVSMDRFPMRRSMVFRDLGFIVLGRLTEGIRPANVSQTQKKIHISNTRKSSIASTKREFHKTSLCLGRCHDCSNTNPKYSTRFSFSRNHFDRKT